MKLFFSIIIFCFSGIILFAKDSTDSLLNNKLSHQQEIVHLLGNQDTLKLMIAQNKKEIPDGNLQKNMPWICAVLLGVFTIIANFQISKQSRKSNKEAIERQIESATTIALKQIENASMTSQLDFNKTVLSGNRQAWINELRELTSRIVTKTMIYSVKMDVGYEKVEELLYLLAKTELMLNDAKDQEFIVALKDLRSCYLAIFAGQMDFPELSPRNEKVKMLTKITLKTEWERVKKGE